MAGERIAVAGSAHVKSISWDPASRVLEVEFLRGRTYRYLGVEYETWTELMRAESKGAFLRRVIQPQHRVELVGEAAG